MLREIGRTIADALRPVRLRPVGVSIKAEIWALRPVAQRAAVQLGRLFVCALPVQSRALYDENPAC